ncbi:hypothetical protein VZT92_011227 [Zoarces viviparus]|uniref:Uncharacterized protein n=1 Tax=Zoarces viviparus TaxID=48416 RepID=A0AAW1FAK9_ZOAVI
MVYQLFSSRQKSSPEGQKHGPEKDCPHWMTSSDHPYKQILSPAIWKALEGIKDPQGFQVLKLSFYPQSHH